MEEIQIFGSESLPEETVPEKADTDASPVPDAIPDQESGGEGEATGKDAPKGAPEGSSQAGEESREPTVKVNFNHQVHDLTLEQARDYAEKGMNYDRIRPALDKLRFLATAGNKSGLEDLADSLIAAHNERLFQSLLGECEGNESIARRLYEAELEKQQKKYESALTQAKNEELAASERLTKRLAEEFVQLQEMNPQLKAFEQVPRTVVDTAVSQNIPLTDAYLRYQYAQDQRAKEAKAAQEAASKASTGAVSHTSADADPALEAARRGIWS